MPVSVSKCDKKGGVVVRDSLGMSGCAARLECYGIQIRVAARAKTQWIASEVGPGEEWEYSKIIRRANVVRSKTGLIHYLPIVRDSRVCVLDDRLDPPVLDLQKLRQRAIGKSLLSPEMREGESVPVRLADQPADALRRRTSSAQLSTYTSSGIVPWCTITKRLPSGDTS